MASVSEKIKALDDQKAELLGQAKAEALTRANAAIKELNGLGFSYKLVGNADSSAQRTGTGTRR